MQRLKIALSVSGFISDIHKKSKSCLVPKAKMVFLNGTRFLYQPNLSVIPYDSITA